MAACTELNEEEKSALKGLSHLQRCVYIFGIRWYMDSKTKISGIKRGISYQGIAEELYVEPTPGIQDTGTPSRMQMRRAVTALEKAGLILNKSVGRKLILECVLARQSESAQNKADTRPTQQADTQADPKTNKYENRSKGYKYSDLEGGTKSGQPGKADAQADTSKSAQADIPPISNRLDKIRLDGALSLFDQFHHLIIKRGYYVNHTHHQKTIAMIHALIKAGITVEEAEIGMQHCDSQLNGKPDVPWYYHKAIMQYRANLAASIKSTEETKNHEANRPTAQSSGKQRLTHEQRRKRMAEWAEKKERELAEEEGSESDKLAL